MDMLVACAHASYMSRMVQIRNVPDTLHRKPTTRAADSARTLSDCLLAELEVSPHGPRVERCWRSSTVESA